METLPRHLKALVEETWRQSGRPHWDKERTVRAAEDADDAYSSQRMNPTPAFRTYRQSGDRANVNRWVLGCHFEWLNPR